MLYDVFVMEMRYVPLINIEGFVWFLQGSWHYIGLMMA